MGDLPKALCMCSRRFEPDADASGPPECNGLCESEHTNPVSDDNALYSTAKALAEPTLLDEAKSLIYGDRADAYGSYADEAQKLATLWGTILGVEIPVEKVPLMMIQLKAVRLSQNPTHEDSWVDIAGYAGCAGKIPSIRGDRA